MQDYTERDTTLGPGVLSDWTGRFIAQLAAPGTQYAPLYHGADPPMHLICDQAARARARLYQAPGQGWKARQAGPVNLWDDIEHAIAAWRQAGEPPQHELGIVITPAAQTVWLDTPAGRATWALPQP